MFTPNAHMLRKFIADMAVLTQLVTAGGCSVSLVVVTIL